MDEGVRNIILGTVGTFVAGGLIWLLREYYQWFISRPLLKVNMVIQHKRPRMSVDEFKAKLGIPFDQELALEPEDTRVIIIKAINPHPKTITIEKLGFLYKSKKYKKFEFMNQEHYEFSHEIEENKATTITIPKIDLFAPLHAAGRRPSDLKEVWFETSTGQIFSNKIGHKTILELDQWYQKWEGHTA
jgi:hypothetical protein